MKKILIISYYFQPCVGIAPNRPTAFANDFSSSCEVKVITKHWEGNENKWEDYLETNSKPVSREKINDHFEIIRTPYFSKTQKPNKLKTLYHLLSGNLDPEIDGSQFFNFAQSIVKEWTPDIIFVSSPPLNLVKVARKLSQKNSIPFFADFRDFENSILLNKESKLNFWENIVFKLRVKHVVSWLKHAAGISTINSELQLFFQNKTKVNTALIYNGYENKLFQHFIPLDQLELDHFTISIIGTIYPGQELQIFLDAFKRCIENNMDIQFKFIGIDTIPEIGDQIRSQLPKQNILITNRIPRLIALEHLEHSHMVWHPEWKNHVGMYSGKIFEYLGSKRYILIAPSVGDVLDNLISETNSGKSLSSEEEIFLDIQEKYTEWKSKGRITYTGDHNKITFYSREHQSQLLLNFIHEQLGHVH